MELVKWFLPAILCCCCTVNALGQSSSKDRAALSPILLVGQSESDREAVAQYMAEVYGYPADSAAAYARKIFIRFFHQGIRVKDYFDLFILRDSTALPTLWVESYVRSCLLERFEVVVATQERLYRVEDYISSNSEFQISLYRGHVPSVLEIAIYADQAMITEPSPKATRVHWGTLPRFGLSSTPEAIYIFQGGS